jgi:hypothetical protein
MVPQYITSVVCYSGFDQNIMLNLKSCTSTKPKEFVTADVFNEHNYTFSLKLGMRGSSARTMKFSGFCVKRIADLIITSVSDRRSPHATTASTI